MTCNDMYKRGTEPWSECSAAAVGVSVTVCLPEAGLVHSNTSTQLGKCVRGNVCVCGDVTVADVALAAS